MTTAAEKRHLDRVAALGCLPCRNVLGIWDSPATCHHIRSGQGMAQRASHWEVLPLCFRHHQGPEGIHTLGTRAWEAKYGREIDLLRQVREELGITEGEDE